MGSDISGPSGVSEGGTLAGHDILPSFLPFPAKHDWLARKVRSSHRIHRLYGYRVTILEHKIASWNVEMYEPTPISVPEEVCVPQSDKINVTIGFVNYSLRVPLSTDSAHLWKFWKIIHKTSSTNHLVSLFMSKFLAAQHFHFMLAFIPQSCFV